LIKDFEKRKVSKISKIIEQEIGGNWLQTNPHDVDFEKCLAVPPVKQVFEDIFNEGKIELWVVLEEDHEKKDGYKIIFDEETVQFGLATSDIFIGLYGSFLDTLKSMRSV
jgi:hypothetical protein